MNDTAGLPSGQFEDLAETSTQVEIASLSTGLLVLLVVIWSIVGDLLVHRTQYLHEGSVACLLGLLTGLVLLLAVYIHSNHAWQVVLENNLLQFNSAAFFTYLLPPVIFNAGLSVEKQRFFHNLPSILAFGVLGTIAAFVMLSMSILWLTQLGLQDCLAIGAIFSATDSVATLQVLDPGSQPLLFSLVFGEGVMNDATSVVLLGAVTRLCAKHCPSMTAGVGGSLLLNFLYLFVTSLLLGSAAGLGIALLMKQWKCKGPHQEVALIGLLAYLGYLGAEVLGLSGILAIFCCGIAVSHYALCNISDEGRQTTVNTFKMLSYVSEGIIFIYVGMDALDPSKWRQAYPGEAVWMFVVLVLMLGISRAAFVIPVSLLHNCWAAEKISGRDMVIIWWAGLVRGAVSVALVYYQFDISGQKGASRRSTLIVTTLVVVLFCTTVLGAATRPLLRMLMNTDGLPHVRALQLLRMGSPYQPLGSHDTPQGVVRGAIEEGGPDSPHLLSQPPRNATRAAGPLRRFLGGSAKSWFSPQKLRAVERSLAERKKSDAAPDGFAAVDQNPTKVARIVEGGTRPALHDDSANGATPIDHHSNHSSSGWSTPLHGVDCEADWGPTDGPANAPQLPISLASATLPTHQPSVTARLGSTGNGNTQYPAGGHQSSWSQARPPLAAREEEGEVGGVTGRRPQRGLGALWKAFDQRYMQPTFGQVPGSYSRLTADPSEEGTGRGG